jgi:hypothetical protein
MSTPIFIEPSTQTVTNVITSFNVNVTNVQLFVSANISVNLYTADPRLIQTVDLPLVGEDYENWANDDQYIIDYVAEKLGFVIAPEPPEPPIDTFFPGFRGQPVYPIEPADPVDPVDPVVPVDPVDTVVPDVPNQPN